MSNGLLFWVALRLNLVAPSVLVLVPVRKRSRWSLNSQRRRGNIVKPRMNSVNPGKWRGKVASISTARQKAATAPPPVFTCVSAQAYNGSIAIRCMRLKCCTLALWNPLKASDSSSNLGETTCEPGCVCVCTFCVQSMCRGPSHSGCLQNYHVTGQRFGHII